MQDQDTLHVSMKLSNKNIVKMNKKLSCVLISNSDTLKYP